jgi:hypothetical protein
MSGQWPPPIQESDGSLTSLGHCRDVVAGAVERSLGASRKHQIVISTAFGGKNYTRSLSVDDRVFASSLCAFLNSQKGETIEEIGNISAAEISR